MRMVAVFLVPLIGTMKKKACPSLLMSRMTLFDPSDDDLPQGDSLMDESSLLSAITEDGQFFRLSSWMTHCRIFPSLEGDTFVGCHWPLRLRRMKRVEEPASIETQANGPGKALLRFSVEK